MEEKTIKIDDSQPFYEGQEVVCVNDIFPMIRTTNEDKSELGTKAKFHPQKNEELVINEILGPFLRFDKYDSDIVGFQWWHHSSFVSKALFRLRELTSQEADLVISDLINP
jgi:hypothetical protein